MNLVAAGRMMVAPSRPDSATIEPAPWLDENFSVTVGLTVHCAKITTDDVGMKEAPGNPKNVPPLAAVYQPLNV